jgi:Ca2+/H+ antiporter
VLTSQILLLVYIIYLLFQLKSHAYMYESMPQHIIDEESTPGPVTAWLETSSSDDSSSSSSDSDTSGHSRDTVSRRVKRVIRGGRRRKSSFASQETPDLTITNRTPSFGTSTLGHSQDDGTVDELRSPTRMTTGATLVDNGAEDAVEEERHAHRHTKRKHRKRSIRRPRKHKRRTISGLSSSDMIASEAPIDEDPTEDGGKAAENGEPRRVDFALTDAQSEVMGGSEAGGAGTRRPFHLRGVSFMPSAKSLKPTVFTHNGAAAMPPVPTGPIPRVRYGIRRTNSLPDRLNEYRLRQPGAMFPSQIPIAALSNATAAACPSEENAYHLSRRAALFLLLGSTGLVALCADFMVESIEGLVATTGVGEIFIGLIILPIVGNAAEHVTAVVVAMKNKMDLAIGVAVGSSIQVALFITPFMVILGWIIGRDMTLYFSLFETVCLFVSAFIVNFLVLDGRSNYLEGALLCATYVIISVVAFYYPDEKHASEYGM